MVIELGHTKSGDTEILEGALPISARAMVFESTGPIRHEVSIPFHDSQVRGAALLIQTSWDQRWGTDAYWEPGPFLSEDLIFRMIRAGVRLAAVDFPVSGRSTETRLITTGKVPIVENLRGLAELPRLGFRLTVVPLEPARDGICAVQALAEL